MNYDRDVIEQALDDAEQPAPRFTAHTFDQINWESAEQETRIGVLQEMVAILLNRIEAAAGQPPPDEAVRRFAKALTEYGVHHGNCPYESWNKRGTRCKCGLFALIKEANAALASPPPTLRVSGTAAPSAIEQAGGFEYEPHGAAPERVTPPGIDPETDMRHYPPTAAPPDPNYDVDAIEAALDDADRLAAPERVGLRPPAVSGLDGATVVRLLHSCGNTLAGWVRHMEGYGDTELAEAIDFVIAHPTLEERLAFFEEQRAAQPAAHSGSVHALGHSAEASEGDE